MEKNVLLTLEGYKKLEEELKYLKGFKKMEIAEKIKIARDFGDLSENAEYDEAKNEQAQLETKILSMEETLRVAKIVENISTKKVGIGVSVNLYDYKYKEEQIYNIVGINEVDTINFCNISIESPLGSALNGKKKGDIIEVIAPEGVDKYKILDIQRTK